ncbi:MAG TPA: carboxymuconolactone decarboxylase family protein [Phycisphaerales bacterium]|nr:carboxymuconolactone decarboxylase family protein [Phycisphaerales bacterium]
MRLEYWKVGPDAYKALAQPSLYLNHASIDQKLRLIVELRVSQINGCAFCVDMHTEDARKAGETVQRLDCVAAWREAHGIYTDRERAAFDLAEHATHLSRGPVPDAVYEAARAHFSEKELVDLVTIIAVMNAWNRLAVTFERGPAPRKG